jgi:hypothetical protein
MAAKNRLRCFGRSSDMWAVIAPLGVDRSHLRPTPRALKYYAGHPREAETHDDARAPYANVDDSTAVWMGTFGLLIATWVFKLRFSHLRWELQLSHFDYMQCLLNAVLPDRWSLDISLNGDDVHIPVVSHCISGHTFVPCLVCVEWRFCSGCMCHGIV